MSIPSAVAILRKVSPVQAIQTSRSMSPEQASPPSPPVAGCSPARTGPAQVAAVQVMPGSSNPNPALACRGVSALVGSSRYRCLRGACVSRKVVRSMPTSHRVLTRNRVEVTLAEGQCGGGDTEHLVEVLGGQRVAEEDPLSRIASLLAQ